MTHFYKQTSMRYLTIFALFAMAQAPVLSHAQTDTAKSDLMNMISQGDNNNGREPVGATFETTRIINGHSIEMTGKGVLDFKISHRFGAVNGGVSQFFGLDGGVTQLGFDYGVTKWLTVGVSRSTYDKEYEGYIKGRILTQTEDNHIPVSL